MLRKEPTLESFTFLPKIHNKLTNIPERQVVTNCGTPTKEVPEYLGFVRKHVMVDGWSYIKDTEDLLKI